MDTTLALYSKTALPQFSGNFNYNEVAKMFLSAGYASPAGNVYQEGLRLSQRLAVRFSIGHGYAYSFLNGVSLYIWDNNKPKLVAQKSFSCYYLSECATTLEMKSMIRDYIRSQCLLYNYGVPTEGGLEELSNSLVKELEQGTAALAKQLSAGTKTTSMKRLGE